MPALPVQQYRLVNRARYSTCGQSGRHAKDPRDQESAVMVRKLNTTASPFTAKSMRKPEKPALLPLRTKSQKRTGHPQPLPRSFEEGSTSSMRLGQKGTTKNYAKILERIGRLREKTAASLKTTVLKLLRCDKNNAIRIEWKREVQSDQKDQHCGVYCLRTNIPDWSEEQLWTTYTMLTEIEATFRSLKTDLGLRPVYHHKEVRVTGHLFITLLAYHLVHTLRYQLKQQGIQLSWDSIRNIMSTNNASRLPCRQMTIKRFTCGPQPNLNYDRSKYMLPEYQTRPIGKCKTIIDKKKSVVPFEIIENCNLLK